MKVHNLKISLEKKKPLVEKSELTLCELGIEGDRHADGGDKQISVYSIEAINQSQSEVHGLCYESYDANIITEGIDLDSLKAGDKLKIGDDAIIMITSHKGKCYEECEKFKNKCYCTLRANALYAKVLVSGKIKKGYNIESERE